MFDVCPYHISTKSFVSVIYFQVQQKSGAYLCDATCVLFFNSMQSLISRCIHGAYPPRIRIYYLRWNIQPSCGYWAAALYISRWWAREEVSYLTIFQERWNFNIDFKVVGVVILTDSGLCGWQRKVATAEVVPSGHCYFPSSTAATLGP